MKRLRLAVLVLFAASAAVLAQTEGVAEFKGAVHTDKNQTIPSQGKVYLSRAAVRVEWDTDLKALAEGRKDSQKPASGLPDHFRMVMIQRLSEPDRIYQVNDEKKTYSVTNLAKEKEKEASKGPERKWKVEKQGRDTVAGFSCEKAVLTAEDGDQTEVCIAGDLVPSASWLAAWNRREEQSTPLKALKDAGINGFPVRWIFRHRGSRDITSSVELVHFEKKSPPASIFEIPADYREVKASVNTLLTPEQQQQMKEMRKKALENMTPEQRQKYEEYMKQHGLEPEQ